MIGVMSDIHGNYPALVAVLRRMEALGVNRIFCLGDVAGYYSEINQCCELVRQSAEIVLQGNHDWYLTSGQGCPRSNSANQCLDFQRRAITDENMEWLSMCSPAMITGNFNLVHGGWHDALDEYFSPEHGCFEQYEQTYFMSGHTHVPLIWVDGEKRYCNPGAVGQPRDLDWRASFATVADGHFVIHRVEYDVKSTQSAMNAAGFSPYFSENLTRGTRIGQ